MFTRQEGREFLEGLHTGLVVSGDHEFVANSERIEPGLARQSISAATEEVDHAANGIGRRDNRV